MYESALNTPLEVGIRVLILLDATYPSHLTINQLVLLDHGILHSADLGGPPSLYPATPMRVGELGIKRQRLEQGLRAMIQSKLVDMSAGPYGVQYSATNEATPFLELLTTDHARELTDRARWVAERYGSQSDDTLRSVIAIAGRWSEEFESLSASRQNELGF